METETDKMIGARHYIDDVPPLGCQFLKFYVIQAGITLAYVMLLTGDRNVFFSCFFFAVYTVFINEYTFSV